ncbi:MAG: FtsQ-type POTRA domain-containing protein [Nitrospirae bacterium]|nr:FtsQ-type POTRA domain-containing protein [Nitrospirota bacterium]
MNVLKKNIHIRQHGLKRKTEKVMSLRLFIAIATIIMLTGCATAGVYMFMKADFLKVQHLSLEGNFYLKESDILKLLNTNGKSLITTDCTQLAQRLMTSPWIKTLFIRKEFPNTLFIKIKEKEPVGILDDGKDTYLIDNAGQRLVKMDKTLIAKGVVPLTQLPVINVDTTNRKAYDEALKLTSALSKNSVTQGKDVLITGKKPEDIAIKINDTLVLLGAGDYEKKIKNYLQLKDEIASRNIPIEYIDVRFSQRLIVKEARRQS